MNDAARERLAMLLAEITDGLPPENVERIWSATEHCGDCTNVAMTCDVCYADNRRKDADRILSAGFVLAAPTQDATETARAVTHEWISPQCWGGRPKNIDGTGEPLPHSDKCEQFTQAIATAITAAEAREREECAKIADACSAIASNNCDVFEQGYVAGWIRARDTIAAAIRAGGGR